MQFSTIMKNAQVLIKHNSSAILTGVAVAGTLSTALLAAKAGYSAAQMIRDFEQSMDDPIGGRYHTSFKEKARICWPLFIPAAGVGTLTIACVLGANHISGKKATALATAYSLSEKAFGEYREKVIEQHNANKELKVRDAVAQDRITNNPPTGTEIHIMPDHEVLCYETMTGRYFSTTVEKLRKAENEFNQELLQEGYASLNNYWDKIGLGGVTVGEELGWTSDKLLDLHISTTLDPKGQPCLSLGYVNAPVPNYWKFR